MTYRYSRLTSLLFIAVSIALGIPLGKVLLAPATDIPKAWLLVSWAVLVMCVVTFARGVQLLVAPPVVLGVTPDGIRVHFKTANAGYSREGDLLPWGLVEGMELVKIHTTASGGRGWSWATVLALSSPPPFDVSKRDPMQIRVPDAVAAHRFHIFTTGIFEISKETLLEQLEAARGQWQRRQGKL